MLGLLPLLVKAEAIVVVATWLQGKADVVLMCATTVRMLKSNLGAVGLELPASPSSGSWPTETR